MQRKSEILYEDIKIIIVESEKDHQTCLFIRRQVFVLGQNIPIEIEEDDSQIDATHILAIFKERPVGTARWRKTDLGIKLERFAVLNEYRNLGVGKSLVLFTLEILKNEKIIYLNAQESVIEFYGKLGFSQVGDRFMEAEIPHQKMVYSG